MSKLVITRGLPGCTQAPACAGNYLPRRDMPQYRLAEVDQGIRRLADRVGYDVDLDALNVLLEADDAAAGKFVLLAVFYAAAQRHNAPDTDPRVVALYRALPIVTAPLAAAGVLLGKGVRTERGHTRGN